VTAAAGALPDRNGIGDGPPPMSERLFEHWASLLKARTGMRLPPERKSFLTTNLSLRMRELGLTDYSDYLHYLGQEHAGVLEWQELVDRLTVHETRFFRDARALACVADVFLPEARRRASAGHPVHVWSAGCATGEEAYTLAMLLDREFVAHRLRPYYGVIGSDLSLRSLGLARQGRYPLRRLDSIPLAYRHYGHRGTDGSFRIADRLRQRVCFMQANLLDCADVPLPDMDLVFCQNVLIYFGREQRRCIVDQLLARLRPGGYLVLGAGEMLGLDGAGVRRVGSQHVLAFQRMDTTGAGCTTV
jgi:chemotaxis methyl-accepting protein methylase